MCHKIKLSCFSKRGQPFPESFAPGSRLFRRYRYSNLLNCNQKLKIQGIYISRDLYFKSFRLIHCFPMVIRYVMDPTQPRPPHEQPRRKEKKRHILPQNKIMLCLLCLEMIRGNAGNLQLIIFPCYRGEILPDWLDFAWPTKCPNPLVRREFEQVM